MMNVNSEPGYFACSSGSKIGRVAARVLAQIRIVERERVVVFDRAENHRTAVRCVGLRFVTIVVGSRRNEENAIEPFEQPRRLRHETMRVVNWIERAAEDADSHE